MAGREAKQKGSSDGEDLDSAAERWHIPEFDPRHGEGEQPTPPQATAPQSELFAINYP